MDHMQHFRRKEERPSQAKVEIAIIAAPQDAKDCQKIRAALEGACRFLEKKELVTVWHRGDIRPGSVTAEEIKKHIQAARIILVLMSRDSLAEPFYTDHDNHMDAIIQRSKVKNVQVIPVLVRPSSWQRSPFKTLAPLPASKMPLSQSPNKEDAIQDIAESVIAFVEEMLESLPAEGPFAMATETMQEKSAMPDAPREHGSALLGGTGGDLAVPARASIAPASTALTSYRRERLEKRRAELLSSLERHDEKIELLIQAFDIETDASRQYQFQEQLLQELQKRAEIQGEVEDIIQQLYPPMS